ncbi:cytochrome c peroxidase [soil metagenome]
MNKTMFKLTTLGLTLLVMVSGCGGGGSSDNNAAATTSTAAAMPVTPTTPAPTLQSVGESLFNEKTLSASAQLACASCHVQAQGHAAAPGSFLPLGGVNGDRQGLRSAPSLNYLDGAGAFRFNAQGDPQGGLFWDGRADSREAQARGPLFNADEMANTDVAALATRLRALSVLADLMTVAQLPRTASDAQLVQASTQAIAAYQAQDVDFHPFSSKFDAVQDGRTTFTAQESRGLAVFNDPQRGNCASCHTSRPGPAGERALFTNFRYFALGVPRNVSKATADPAFFDLGLCGPQRADLAARADLCGMFRVPTLRNIALTAPYFHNAALQTLDEAVAFYASRDSEPARWYPSVGGQVQRFNDLPAAYRANVQHGAPFDLQAGRPSLNAQDVADIVVFLQTLSDGFVVGR